VQDELDRAAGFLIDAAPGHWIRIVLLAGRLVEDDGTLAGFTDVTVAVTWDGTELGQRYVAPPPGQRLDAFALDAASAGQPEEGWTVLWMILDRDGGRTFDFSHEEARPLDDSASDEYWDAAHDYLERNRPELEALADRLRASGRLPGADDVTPIDPMTLPPSQRPGVAPAPAEEHKGRLGRLFGRG
jgi:hypothetical protein